MCIYIHIYIFITYVLRFYVRYNYDCFLIISISSKRNIYCTIFIVKLAEKGELYIYLCRKRHLNFYFIDDRSQRLYKTLYCIKLMVINVRILLLSNVIRKMRMQSILYSLRVRLNFGFFYATFLNDYP